MEREAGPKRLPRAVLGAAGRGACLAARADVAGRHVADGEGDEVGAGGHRLAPLEEPAWAGSNCVVEGSARRKQRCVVSKL